MNLPQAEQFPMKRSRLLAILALAASFVAFGGAVQASDLVMTSYTSGTERDDDEPMPELDSARPLEIPENGKCSVLIAGNVVVSLCNGASASFPPPRPSGPRVIDLEKGHLKANVGEQPAGRPLEIHTPAAIATLMGTVVHLAVDPDSGDSVISSIENRIRVESHDPEIEGFVILEPGEQVTVATGARPGRVRRIDMASFASSSDCLDDDAIRKLAAARAQQSRQRMTLAIVTGRDIPLTGLDPVSAGPGVRALAATRIETATASCIPGTSCSSNPVQAPSQPVTVPPLVIAPAPPAPAPPGGGLGTGPAPPIGAPGS